MAFTLSFILTVYDYPAPELRCPAISPFLFDFPLRFAIKKLMAQDGSIPGYSHSISI
jgi:hypothetical protein